MKNKKLSTPTRNFGSFVRRNFVKLFLIAMRYFKIFSNMKSKCQVTNAVGFYPWYFSEIELSSSFLWNDSSSLKAPKNILLNIILNTISAYKIFRRARSSATSQIFRHFYPPKFCAIRLYYCSSEILHVSIYGPLAREVFSSA